MNNKQIEFTKKTQEQLVDQSLGELVQFFARKNVDGEIYVEESKKLQVSIVK